MKKIHSLSFRIPAIISLISVALIVIILLIAVNFANMGISEKADLKVLIIPYRSMLNYLIL